MIAGDAQDLEQSGRIYPVNPATRRMNQLIAVGSAVLATALAIFGLFKLSSISTAIMLECFAAAIMAFAGYALGYNHLATVLYTDRIVSRGLFRRQALLRAEIAGFEMVPERSGPPTLRLVPKDPKQRHVNVYRFLPDDAFRDWLTGIPDLRLAPATLRRKRRVRAIVAAVVAAGWSLLLIFGFRQAFDEYEKLLALQRRGVVVEGVVVGKSTVGRSHARYLDYRYKTTSGQNESGEAQIGKSDYNSFVVGDMTPVIYDPVHVTASYPSTIGLLRRMNLKDHLRRTLLTYGVWTLILTTLMVGAYIADGRAAKKPF